MNMENPPASPRFIELSAIGALHEGYISVAEAQKNIPFEIKRVYWTYYTPQNVIRGFHAHKQLEQVIFALGGKITFTVEDRLRNKKAFTLEEPHIGLYLPPLSWREIQFSHTAVLLCLASEHYSEEDYIRNYQEFRDAIRQA
jgi:dTDP-4-dehydrorhamnose 3,5-epimerase-like enzyme